MAAQRLVRNNVYYGYARDLDITNYKSLAYVAKELLIKAAGKGSLAQYRGWVRLIAYQQDVDRIIDDFVNRASAAINRDNEDVIEELINIDRQVDLVNADYAGVIGGVIAQP